MADEIKGTVAEEGQVATTEQVPEQQEVVPSPETGEIEKLQAKITELEADNRGKSQAITRLSGLSKGRSADDRSVAQYEHLTKLVELSLQQQSGQFDGTAGSVEDQKRALTTGFQEKMQALEQVGVYESHVNESLETIKDILQSRGFNPDDDNVPEVKEIQALYNDALNKGQRFDSVIAKAVKIVATSKVKDAQPSREEIEKEVRQRIHEEEKKSLKVETGGPLSPTEATAEQRLKARYPTMNQ